MIYLIPISQEPANAQQSFSMSRHPSVWRTIPVLEFLRESWTNLANHPSFSPEIRSAINAGLENVDKWYQKTDDTDMYFVCLGAYIFFCLRRLSKLILE